MSIPHRCPVCAQARELPEVNDDVRVSPKLRLDELIQISHHGLALYRILKLDGMQILIEKIN